MFEFLSVIIDYFGPVFLVASPITSYADQILSIHRNKTSAGFSLDIPLIMLVASILKVFYWFGAHYSIPLLIQATLMIGVQLILLKVALDNRPPTGAKDGLEHAPFSSYTSNDYSLASILEGIRPYDFWRWPTSRPYFTFLAYLGGLLLAIQILTPFISSNPTYINLIGYTGLAVEAILPVPQIYKNHTARSCKGFRVSVIANWLAGDAMKMSYFFLSKEYIPWPFRLCGMFQACCDSYLGFQFYMYGSGTGMGSDMRMGEMGKTVLG